MDYCASKKSIAKEAFKSLKLQSNTSCRVSNGPYLLKPSQVPINELIKLKLAFDLKREIEHFDEQRNNLSKKRYMELTA